VHGGFVDGSGWQAVHDLLTKDGYRVAVVQNPTLSLEDDAAVTRQVIDSLEGPVVLGGHSYGGAVITEAGLHVAVAGVPPTASWAPCGCCWCPAHRVMGAMWLLLVSCPPRHGRLVVVGAASWAP
jgi:hypothetical protein